MNSTPEKLKEKISLKDINYRINIDKVKESYGKQNPEKRRLTNNELSKLTGKTPQYFADLNNVSKSKPDMPLLLLKLSEISGLPVEELIEIIK